ncbi:hypothetical protein CC86DRAFT_94073 [Ophiobolus disseminans]|uniref:Uncharacterized protein n=1 Tax=Ophiobolus disseminans TaxID=1469910 RepID=A0A6A6ZNG9_9PLEO|nr:hypothetical protein CC86DRAFT_94073 [Ophiobolus disseminans]
MALIIEASYKPIPNTSCQLWPTEIAMLNKLYDRSTTKSSDDDPFGISQVSGFYGPGALAAWILALLSSWYTVAHRPSTTTNYNIFLHVLYTNVAALDFFLQLLHGTPSYAAVVAPAAICYWGSLHTFVLQRCDSFDVSRSIETILRFGTFLPATSLLVLLNIATINLWGSRIGFLEVLFPEENIAPAMQFVLQIWFSAGYIAALLTGLITLLFSIARIRWVTISQWFRACFFVALTPVLLFSIILSTFIRITRLSTAGVRECSVYRPCASQSISELDQSFALVCGLVMFMFEMGADLFQIAQRLTTFLFDWYLSRRGF